MIRKAIAALYAAEALPPSLRARNPSSNRERFAALAFMTR
jgi:hypothetical protein